MKDLNIDAETIDKAYSWFKRNDYNVNLDIFTNNVSIIIGDEGNNDFDTFELSNKEILQRAKMFDETYAEKKEEIKSYGELDIDELFHLSGEYSNYVQECSYCEDKPVSIYEFMVFYKSDAILIERKTYNLEKYKELSDKDKLKLEKKIYKELEKTVSNRLTKNIIPSAYSDQRNAENIIKRQDDLIDKLMLEIKSLKNIKTKGTKQND